MLIMKWKWFFCLWLVIAPVMLHAEEGDARILAAKDAATRGDRASLQAMLLQPSDHVLEPYVRYWALVTGISRQEGWDAAAAQTFLSQEKGGYLAEKVASEWAKRLAKSRDWASFLSVYPTVTDPDMELRCFALTARYATGDSGVLQEIGAGWETWLDAPSACDEPLSAVVAAGRVGEDAVWMRFRRQVAQKRIAQAQSTLAFLSGAQVPSVTEVSRALNNPAAYLDKLPPTYASTRGGRALAVAAITRLARDDTGKAVIRMAKIGDSLPEADRAFAYGMICWRAGFAQNPVATTYCKQAGTVELPTEAGEWRVRVALRSGDWAQVSSAILALSNADRGKPEWTYWLGRAYAAQGQQSAAQTQFQSLAGESHFYGMLAAEELGKRFSPSKRSTAVTEADRRRVERDPSLVRALALYRLGLRPEAQKEWNFAIRGQDEIFLAAASRLALNHQIYDRAIQTADRANTNANFDLRYLAPYRDIIEPEVNNQALPLSWVYGLMRQESRFVVPARSSVGAQGLMQVMPTTARWVANKLGLTDYHPGWLTDPNQNVKLGTSYMRLIMDGLDQHPVLASAGYNAGPGRAKRWRDDRALEGAIYVETIPFDETRDYVKKVMANTVVYSTLFGGKADSIKKWLGTIGAQDESSLDSFTAMPASSPDPNPNP